MRIGLAILAGVMTMGSVQAGTNGNEFGLELFRKLAAEPGNVTVSPVSIALALAMTREGAVGQTREVMSEVLRLDEAPKLARDLAGAMTDGNTVAIANAIWPAKGKPVHPEFVTKVRAYDAGLTELDYAGDTEGSRKTINAWVAGKTADKIKELLAKDDVKPGTPMVLTNAVYLKAKWESPFKVEGTHSTSFHAAGQVPTMHQQGTFPAAEVGDVKVLELPYRGARLALTVVLPKAIDGLPAVEASLTPAVLDGWVRALKPRLAMVGLPKLKLRWHEKLKGPLEAIGMGLAFDDAADFSAMRPPPPTLKIGEVIHETTMDVDEEGTEASAATAVIMAPGGAAGPREEPFQFQVDRPFLALLRDRQTGAILFLARVHDPRAE